MKHTNPWETYLPVGTFRNDLFYTTDPWNHVSRKTYQITWYFTPLKSELWHNRQQDSLSLHWKCHFFHYKIYLQSSIHRRIIHSFTCFLCFPGLRLGGPSGQALRPGRLPQVLRHHCHQEVMPTSNTVQTGYNVTFRNIYLHYNGLNCTVNVGWFSMDFVGFFTCP